MPFDPGVATQIKPFEMDVSKPLLAAASIGNIQAETQLKQYQAGLIGAKIQAAQGFSDAMAREDDEGAIRSIGKYGALDPEGGKNLLSTYDNAKQLKAGLIFKQTENPAAFDQFPQLKEQFTRAVQMGNETARENAMFRMSVAGRYAAAYQALPAEQKSSPDAWNSMINGMAGAGALRPNEAEVLRGKPNDMHVAMWVAGGMAADKYREQQGTTAHTTAPGTTVNAPPDVSTPTIATPPAQNQPTAVQPTAPSSTKEASPSPDKVNAEVPKVSPAGGTAKAPGVLVAGTDPVQLKAREDANEDFQKNIVSAGRTATKTRGELGSIISELQSKNINPNTFAKWQETVAGLIYAVGGQDTNALDTAKKLTGIDPSAAEVLNKNTTRLGFDMSREQGAREAVQVIQFALAANPNILQTREGALKVAKILDKQAQWSEDKLRYGEAWRSKNGDPLGFDSWFNGKYSLRSYLSHVIPYQIQKDAAPEHGITYSGQHNGKPFVGTYNQDSHQFEDVRSGE